MDMAKRLKELRRLSGKTLEEVGKIIGVQKAAVHKLENGTTETMKRTTIVKLCNLYGVTPSYLMAIEEETPTNNHVVGLDTRIPKDEAEILTMYRQADTQIKQTVRTILEACKPETKKGAG